jgi:hypothetical protein
MRSARAGKWPSLVRCRPIASPERLAAFTKHNFHPQGLLWLIRLTADFSSRGPGGGDSSTKTSHIPEKKQTTKNIISQFRPRKPRLRPRGSAALTTWYPLHPLKMALTSPTGGGRSVGIVRSRTNAMELLLLLLVQYNKTYASNSSTERCI